MKLAAAASLVLLFAVPALAQSGVTKTPATPAATQPAAPKAKVALYDEKADVRELIAAAQAKAKKNNRRVLIQWGGNWCGWCITLDKLTKSDKDIAKTLMYEYDVVHADAGGRTNKNLDLMKQYGARPEDGFPFLTIIDADGRPIINQETSSLEVKNAQGDSTGIDAGHDPKKVLGFLKQHAAAPLKAADVLASGIADARSSGRTVFLHFGAPWCVWCHRLEDWMARPEVAKVIAKDFVDVKIDVERMTGGQDVFTKYCPRKDAGIPWFVFLQGEGAALITSDGPKGNVGFPAAPEEIEHFTTMLAKARKNMTEAEAKGLIESLKAEKH